MNKARRELSASAMDSACIFCSNDLRHCYCYYNSGGYDIVDCTFCKSGLSKYDDSHGSSKYEIWYENGPNKPKTVEYVRLNKYALRQDYQENETRLYTLLPTPLVFKQESEKVSYHFGVTLTIPILENLNLSQLTDNQIEAYLLLS